ncbi:MAG: glycosyltransferase, partial [Lachnospiraceae bacterium]|nr:glycosyltransferase [Lachnospiraceae bacterium]
MKKEKDMIAFYPYYVQGNSYVQNMISVWSKKYTVIAFNNHNISTGKIRKCKAIILNWYENDLNIYQYMQLLKCKLYGIKILQVFHNRIPHNSKNSIAAWIKMKSVLLLSNTILLHSKNSRACLKQYGRNEVRKAVYVPHINYCGDFEYTEVDYREELGLKSDDFVFMFFGFMAPHKNIELLIQVFNEWNIDNAKLLIVGSPSNKQYVKKIKESCLHRNIIIHGKYIPNSEVYAYFNTCDVVVMPYQKESYINSGVMINAFS